MDVLVSGVGNMSAWRTLIRLVVTTLFVVLGASCGGGGYGGGGGGSTPPATLTLSLEPTTITLGQSATLTWTTNGASCTASGAWSGTKSAGGSETVTPTATGMFSYALSCLGGGYGESDGRSVTLTVNPAASAFTMTLLVSGFGGSAAITTDPKLVSPMGLAFVPGASARVASSSMSTEYDGNGKLHSPPRTSAAGASAIGINTTMDPTGIVANSTPDFVITAPGESGPAQFIFAGKGGMLGGGSRDLTEPTIAYAASDGAVYLGLALASNSSGTFVYATDFRNNKIDVFDGNFRRMAPRAGRFNDPALPAGYAPFGIQAVQNAADGSTQIYVTYARQIPPDNRDNAIGAGLGLVNVFDTTGTLLRRLVPDGGPLDAPWGIALAPADFGSLSNALLIGNSGDGRINAFDPATGKFVGTVSDADARPIATRGLRALAFGNGSHSQPHNTLFFTAATDETDGIFGRIDVGAMPPPLELAD